MNRISVLTRKSIADVTRRKGRTVLMILGILISILGLTAVNVANDMIGGAFLYSTDPGAVPDITFAVDAVPSSVAMTLQHLPNVEKFQLRTEYDALWYLSGNAGTATIQINAYQDSQHVQLGAFQITSGRLPGRGEIVMDSSDRAVQPVALGDTVTVDLPDRSAVSLHVVGLARTRGRALQGSLAQALAYMSPDALQQIAQGQKTRRGPALTTAILVKTHDSGSVQQTFNAIARVLDGAHIKTFDAHWTYATSFVDIQLAVTGLLNVIRVLSIFALLLVCLMIINTVSTLLTEQMKIIGTMKAIGGTSFRIMRSYLVSVGIYGIIGMALGFGLGLVLCYEVSSIVSSSTSVDLGPFQVSPRVVVTSVATGLLVPLLAALVPLWIGTRITVREAMAAYGVRTSASQHSSALRPQARWMSWVPQTAWLGLRGVFRRPGRAVLTLLALSLAGAVFMAVQITNESIGATVEHEMHLYAYDMRVDLGDNPISSQQVITALRSLRNVERIEAVDEEIVTTAKGALQLTGLSANTQFYQPNLVAGHWLTTREQGTIVINDFAARQLNLHVGDLMTVRLGTRQASWKIAGIMHEVYMVSGSASTNGRIGLAFTTLENLNETLRNMPADATTRLWVRAHDRSQLALQQLRGQIQRVLKQAGLQNTYISTPLLDLAQGPDPLLIIYSLFDTVAILVALVGLLGLSHTLSASVLERRLEIGILRSLGATDWRVGVVFCIEGLALAAIAWGCGVLLGLPGGAAILNMLGTFIQPFDISFNPLSILTTLLFVVVVSLVAGFGPALSASRVRIRETLRYQ